MTKRRSSLTGSWSGAFRYAGDVRPETVFEARIVEHANSDVTGPIRELDTTYGVLDADIQGARDGATLTFLKIYDERFYVVTYDGKIDEALERVEGSWDIPDVLSGTLFMTRDRDEESPK